MDEFRKENKQFLNNLQENNTILNNQNKENLIPRKFKFKTKETITNENFHESGSWKRMLQYFNIKNYFNDQITPENTKTNFCSCNIDKIKKEFDKKIMGIVVFLSNYEAYNDIVHAKFMVRSKFYFFNEN